MMKSDPIKIFSRIHDVVAPLLDLVRYNPDITVTYDDKGLTKKGQ